ncbi:MAG: pyruvate kinase, partial [Candidatus Nanoarchaeia archaeon]|nr:pyruvate kinase [Candidatus Nanoarchaeia archaeon]
ASYSRTAGDIKQVRKVTGDLIKIIGKPENYEGEKNLIEIIKVCDAMMVPRGDYGMERGVENVPAFQKRLIELCNIAGIPVITATQMLESLMYGRAAKRPESTDIFNAVLDGTDVTMLSGETSMGNDPVRAVRVMERIIRKAEQYLYSKKTGVDIGERINRMIKENNVSDRTSKRVYEALRSGIYEAVISPAHHGTSTKKMSRFRIKQLIYAFCDDEKVRRYLNMSRGVIPLPVINGYFSRDPIKFIEESIRIIKSKGYVKSGDNVIVVAGMGNYAKGNTNLVMEEIVK